jgi:hypothetical protein
LPIKKITCFSCPKLVVKITNKKPTCLSCPMPIIKMEIPSSQWEHLGQDEPMEKP